MTKLGVEHEQGLLGSALRDNGVFPEVALMVQAEDFTTDAHQRVFRAIAARIDEGKPADLVTVAEWLYERGEIADVTYPYLGELWDAAPTAANAVYYARIVRDRAIRRRMIQVAQEIIDLAKHPTGPVEELLGEAEKKILSVSQLGVAGHVVEGRELVPSAFDRYDTRADRPGAFTGIPCGLLDIDRLTAGSQNGEVSIIAARPSVGKTSLGAQIARQVSLREGLPVFFVSLEQSRNELIDKFLCSEANIDSHRLRLATLDREERTRFIEAGHEIERAAAQIFIDDQSNQSMVRIAANARRLRLRPGIRLVIIDYLQLIEPENRKVPRHEQVAGISRRLKLLARELGIPVIALAQLNRQVEGANRQPRLSDLRESGGIEADADTVILLHCVKDEDDVRTIEAIIAKQRNGPTAEVSLIFRKDSQRFENYAPEA